MWEWLVRISMAFFMAFLTVFIVCIFYTTFAAVPIYVFLGFLALVAIFVGILVRMGV